MLDEPTATATAAQALRKMAAELRAEAEYNAKTSRDFGRGMAWAATIVAARADDAEVGPMVTDSTPQPPLLLHPAWA